MDRVRVVVAPGLELVAQQEAKRLNLNLKVEPGALVGKVKRQDWQKYLVNTRVATRLALELGGGAAPTLSALAGLVKAIDWRPYLQQRQQITVRAHVDHRLRPKAVQKKVADAIADNLRGPRREQGRTSRQEARVDVHISKGRCSITLDAGGELLHKRGVRKAMGGAPIRENLAAGLLLAAGYDGSEALYDPMCGSGTFLIEGAGISGGVSAGVKRTYAFEQWPCMKSKVKRLAGRTPSAFIGGSDLNESALKACRSNLKAAGLGGTVSVSSADAFDAEPPGDRGLMVINPPYGHRLRQHGAPRLIRALGPHLASRWRGWRVAILVPNATWVSHWGIAMEERLKLKNGGIQVYWMVGNVDG